MPEWEPGDDICPPWPWWKHWPGPRPPWWDRGIVKLGQEVFAGLTLINAAGHIADAHVSSSMARLGAEMVSKSAHELQQLISKAKG
jgi:hypothetical protein